MFPLRQAGALGAHDILSRIEKFPLEIDVFIEKYKQLKEIQLMEEHSNDET